MKLPSLLSSLAVLAQLTPSFAADTNSWKSRTIYFALTDRIARTADDQGGSGCSDYGNYCGGTFRGLQGKLDYIQKMGFDAIWISPVVENSPRGYHGYWAKDLYKINPKFGTSDDLKNLVNAAHNKGIYVMVDVVANHMGNDPISQDSPPPLNQNSSYHTPCDINYDDQYSIEHCSISGLPDVNTTDPTIRKLYQDWIKWLIGTYKFDGIRIDTVKHVEKDFWPPFALAGAVYSIGEVYNGDPNYLKGYAGLMSGLLDYGVYFPLNKFYKQQGSSQDLVDMHNRIGNITDATTWGTFLENHDNPRFLSDKNDVSLYKNAIAYVMLSRGIPIIYYGTEQSYAGGADPYNREDLWRVNYKTDDAPMYRFLTSLGSVRKSFGGLPNDDHKHLMVEDTGYAWGRANGKIVVLTSNIGQGQSRQYCIYTQKPNTTWKNIFDGKTYSSNGDGIMCATVTNGEPMVFVQ